ncbi:hypothetical protein ES703_60575 [subsurface metagenome]
MALVVLPEGQQRSGAQGGIVWSHNAAGPYVRSRSIPVNPNTDRQAAVRNAVRNLSIFWETVLTQGQRDGWDVYAAVVTWVNRLGKSIKLTGLNHYVRCNVQKVVSGIDTIAQAPAIQDIGDAEDQLACTASEGTQDLTIDGNATAPWLVEAAGWQFYYMGLPQNASRKFFGGPYRFVTATPGAGPPPFPIVIASPWVFQEGQRIWLRSRIQRGDGRLSEFAQINFLAAA